MNYQDFDLLIEGAGNGLRAQVLNSPAGQASTEFLPFSEVSLENFLLRLGGRTRRAVRRVDSREMNSAKTFGAALFNAVFSGDVKACFRSSLDESRRQDAGLRIRLRLADPSVIDVPWEYLYNPATNRFLALSIHTPLVRYIDLPERIQPIPVTLPIRVLVTISSPTDFPTLDVEAEWTRLNEALADLIEKNQVAIERLDEATLGALQRRLRRERYHIFHFIGHGEFDDASQEGVLILEGDQGRGHRVASQFLGMLLHDHESLRVVILNACEGARASRTDPFAGSAQSLVQQGIPAVIAMQFEIADDVASRFAHEFYGALADGYPIDAAVTEARKSIFADGREVEWATPVLYMRVPDGRVFEVDLTTPAERARVIESARAYENSIPVARFQQVQEVERDARYLQECTTIDGIRGAHRRLAAVESSAPASSWLRSFRRASKDVDTALNQESAFNQRLALNAIEDRLDNLLRELERSGDPYGYRVQPSAQKWRQVIAEHVEQLRRTVERRQEIDNPYVIGVPLTEEQELFVGRTDVGARIETLLLDRRRPPLLLFGQRRMGKTSLLNNLGRLLPSTIVPLFVDLQGPVTQASNSAGFLYNLARGMRDSALRHRNLTLERLTRESLAPDPFTRFDEWLDEVERDLGDNTALLALDEFEALDNMLSKDRFDADGVFATLRHMIQHRSRFKVLLAGAHTAEELAHSARYLINVQLIKLGYLKEEETRHLVERPVRDFALAYDPDATRRVIEITRGHPFLVQQLCAEIVTLKNEQRPEARRRATIQDVEAAIPEALQAGTLFFADIESNQIPRNSLELLRDLARRGEGAIAPEDRLSREYQGEHGSVLSPLLRRDVIERVDGGYRVQVELIRRWFARQQAV